MKFSVFSLLFILTSFLTYAQNNECACCTYAHNQFNFWVGEWEVFNEKGEKVGENFIEKLEDNCILSENWSGEKGGSGKSYNYYNPADSTWNQLWLSNSGTILKLKGGLAQTGKMILKSDIIKDKKASYYNQIIWTRNPDGSVTQLWEIYDPQGHLLNEAFKGIYRKKP